MKSFISPLLLAACFASCSNPAPKADPAPSVAVPDSPTAVQDKPSAPLPATPPPAIDSAKLFPLRGVHRLTLQWISWDDPGSVYFTPTGDSTYRIRGEQRASDGGYVRIEGTVRQQGAKKLLFNGRVESRVSTVNAGQPCIKEGEQVFLSTKGRQYWRMQDMINCEGGRVTDYVDIYFE